MNDEQLRLLAQFMYVMRDSLIEIERDITNIKVSIEDFQNTLSHYREASDIITNRFNEILFYNEQEHLI